MTRIPLHYLPLIGTESPQGVVCVNPRGSPEHGFWNMDPLFLWLVCRCEMTGRMPLPVPWVQCCCCRCHCCCHVEHVGTHRGNSGTALTTEVSYVNNRGVEVFRVSGSFVDATLSSEKTKPRAGPQISSGLSDYKKRSQANSIRGRLFFAVAKVPFQHRGWCRVCTYIAGHCPVHTPAASVLVSENGVGKVNRVVVCGSRWSNETSDNCCQTT